MSSLPGLKAWIIQPTAQSLYSLKYPTSHTSHIKLTFTWICIGKNNALLLRHLHVISVQPSNDSHATVLVNLISCYTISSVWHVWTHGPTHIQLKFLSTVALNFIIVGVAQTVEVYAIERTFGVDRTCCWRVPHDKQSTAVSDIYQDRIKFLQCEK